jgi:integrase
MTRDHYGGLWEKHIEPVLGEITLADMTPEDVRDWFGGLDDSKPTMKARAYGLLTAILNTAVDDDLIPRSPAKIKGGTAVKRTQRSVVLLEADDLSALAAKMPPEIKLTVLLAGWCALRRGELFALTRADVGDKCATINIDKAVLTRRGRTEVGPPKTKGSIRTVTVPPPLRPMIAAHLENHVEPASSALLFEDPVTGGHYTEGRFRGPFNKARDAIGREGLHFHDLRHFGGVMAAIAGGTTAEVMDRLGHTTSAASMRYQHVAAGRAALLADRLAALLPTE